MTSWTAACQTSLSHLLEFAQVHFHCMSSHLILWCPLLLLPSIFPSIRVFFQWVHIRWPKYWPKIQLQHQSYQWVLRVDLFNIGWFHLLAVQGTLKNLLQHHSLKASFLQCSAFFIVQLSQPYMTTGKTIALTIQTFVSKLMSLLFNTLSFFIAFLPRRNCLLISWL